MSIKWNRKLLAGLLAASMAFNNIPVTVFAEADFVETVGTEEFSSETWTEEAALEQDVPDSGEGETPAAEPAEEISQQEVFVIEEYPETDMPVDTDSYETSTESEIPPYESYEEQPAEEQPADEEFADEEFADEEFAEEEIVEEDPEAIAEWLVESDEEEFVEEDPEAI